MAFQTSGFPFYRIKGSNRNKRHSIRESSESSFSRWLRELKGGSENSKQPQLQQRTLDRSNPLYHSEGKGLRPRRRDTRRLSFNEHASPKPRRNKHRSHGESAGGSQSNKGQQEMSAAPTTTASIYSILHSSSGLNFAPGCGAPVRDSASLKGVRYGPGHEKFPSWPGEADSHSVVPHGGSSRSKSWTDHTNYPKEKNPPVVRPFMKRPNSAFTQQLKTVMERCEKIPPETFESRQPPADTLYLPRLDRDGKVLGDSDYSVPSPPERDLTAFSKPQLTQADLEEYAKSYQDPQFTQVGTEGQLTRAELEQYTRAYEESNSLRPSHQTQASYAQSEGYHSYVSSTDSTTTTPFLDRLRRDSDAVGNRASFDESRVGRESSASSGSSSETLKWHGSLSDVSSLSSSSNTQNPPPSGLIAHSSRVPPPQRHHSESVLYLGAPPWVQRNNQINNQMRRLFPVSTYTVQPSEQTSPRSPPALSVAERISELEKQQQQQQAQPQLQQQPQIQQHQSSMRLNCLENDKRTRVTDHASLKAIQKKALLSFYERHHSAWKSEPQLGPQAPPPQPPPRPRPPSHASRRSSSASDYAGASWREMAGINKEGHSETTGGRDIRHQHSSSCGSLSTAVLGPLIVGPSISVDDWVPARPPKKPHLRAAYPAPPRPPSPDLPPPSPPPVVEDEVFISDEPLPPPPSEDQLPEWINRQSSPVKQCQTPSRSQTNSTTKQLYSQDRSAINASASLDSLNRSDFKYNSHFSPDRLKNSSQKSIPDKSVNMHYENQSEMIRHSSMINSSNDPHNKKIREQRDCFYETPMECRQNSSELLHRQTSSEFFRQNSNEHEKFRNSISRQDSMEQYRNGIDVRLQLKDCVKINDDSKNSSNHGRKIADDGRKMLDNNLVMSPRLSDCWRTYDSNLDQQPRSLDSNFSINESRYETNHSKPGPQTPLDKKLVSGLLSKQSNLQSASYSDTNVNGRPSESKSLYQFNRENNIVRSSIRKDSLPNRETSSSSNFADIKNIFQQGVERQSARFTTTKLVVNGKIANAVHNGTVSPTRKCAPISQFTRNSVRRNGPELSSSIEEKEINGKMPLTLPPQCPPTSHQLSQSKASYLAREPRERDRSRSGILNFEGSYKRTMSPSGGQLTIENQEPVKEKSSPPPSVPVNVTPVPVKEIISLEEKQPLPETKKAPSQENLVSPLAPTSCDKMETSKTLPRNYSLSVAMKRPARTPRTHSDPVHATSRERDNNFEPIIRRVESPKKSPVEELRKEEQKSVANCRVPSPSVSVATSTDEMPSDNNTEIIINCSSVSSNNVNSNENNNSCNSCEDRTVNSCSDQEPLRLVQRSEVTLRVNATTSDAASQTEATRTPSPQTAILRHPLQEEIECDQLSRDLASQLSPSHRLQGILAPGPEVKRCTDYVSGLFRLDVTPRSRTSLASTVAIPAENSSSNTATNSDNSSSKEKVENVQSLSANSAYFTTSECKAKLLTLCSRNQPEALNSIGGIDSLHQKKEELMTRLSRKLCVLRAEAVAVAEESRVNETLGEGVTNRISNVARPHESAKLKLHIKEVGHITSLLLGLSGRLARAENALLGMGEDDNDRKLMEEKRDKLRAQLEEAKQLKVSIDRRSGSVSTMLYKYLSAEEYADYDHFINMKAKLLIDSREITDKIQLGEEQLAALQETLNEQSR